MKRSDKDNNIRLQVFLSRNGVCSRRQAMDMIQQGHVKVNGKEIREPSFEVDPHKDHIAVNQKLVQPKRFGYVLLNKPKGYMTTKADRFAEKTIYDLLPKKYFHLAPVGRLDKDTEGLLILTNNGDVAHRLTHPRFDIDKTYYAVVKGQMESSTIARLENGIYIQGKKTAKAKISHIQKKRDETNVKITIHEGKKRQIRIMFAKVGHKVQYLKRIVQGPIKLGNLKCGRFRELSKGEIQNLLEI